MDPLILVAFGDPPDNVDLAESRTRADNAAVIILILIASIAVALRLMARKFQHVGLKADDYIILASLIFVYATAGLSIAGGHYGAGKHIWTVEMSSLVLIIQILYGYTFVYAATVSSIKISILFFYHRVFTSNDLAFKISLLVGGFLSSAYPIIIWVTMGNCCSPITYYWNQFHGAEGHCIDVNTFYLALGIINMVNDVIILTIPIPQILKLQMSTRKKAAVCGIMLLGSFVCIASIVRIYYLAVFIKTVDVTWLMGPVFIWSSVEPSIGILSACLPNLRPLFRSLRERMSSAERSHSSDRTGQRSGSSDTPWRSGGHAGQRGSSYGGSRFGFGSGDGALKLVEEEDEIHLTNRAMGGSRLQKHESTASEDQESLPGHVIIVESSIEQSSCVRDGRA
ncbi:pth11-like integral membrane protein [Lasiodiplodia theobromae]|nr:pth11-like integral membrane protein [Lasiodiplodia theobromae]